MCGVHLNTVHNWITRGELHAYKLGPRTVRVLPEDFAAFMERKQGGTNEEPAH
jgi:DNA binding domain, excisionase family